MTALALALPDRRRLLGMARAVRRRAGRSMIVGLLLIAAAAASASRCPTRRGVHRRRLAARPYAIGASINRAVALALVGLGFILAFRANLTNVGGEGQIAVGGIAATALAPVAADRRLPLGLARRSCRCWRGTLAGAFWGGIAGLLKVRVGTNEVISTLLLCFVALLAALLVRAVDARCCASRMTTSATLPESLEIADATKLPLPDRQRRHRRCMSAW